MKLIVNEAKGKKKASAASREDENLKNWTFLKLDKTVVEISQLQLKKFNLDLNCS